MRRTESEMVEEVKVKYGMKETMREGIVTGR